MRERERRGPEVVGEGKRAPVLTKGSVQGIVCKRHVTGVELGGFGGGAEAGVRWRWGLREGLWLCMLMGALKRG